MSDREFNILNGSKIKLRDSDGFYGEVDFINDIFVFNKGFDITGKVTLQGALFLNLTTINEAEYSLLSTDNILHVTYTETGAVQITLPSAQAVAKRTIIIKDAGGNAGTNYITIVTQGSETIDGSDTAVINSDYSSINLYSDGANWFIY